MKVKIAFPGGKTFLLLRASPRWGGWRVDRGPFGCWEIYMGRIKIGWVLTRWL